MVKSMILFKNILARILKNNLDFFFKVIFQYYFAKILDNNLEKLGRGALIIRGVDLFTSGGAGRSVSRLCSKILVK